MSGVGKEITERWTGQASAGQASEDAEGRASGQDKGRGARGGYAAQFVGIYRAFPAGPTQSIGSLLGADGRLSSRPMQAQGVAVFFNEVEVALGEEPTFIRQRLDAAVMKALSGNIAPVGIEPMCGRFGEVIQEIMPGRAGHSHGEIRGGDGNGVSFDLWWSGGVGTGRE